jgi:hypothetical protein
MPSLVRHKPDRLLTKEPWMQQCRPAPLGITVALACLAGCTSAPQPATSAPQPAEHPKQVRPAPHPAAEPAGAGLLVPQVITLRGPAKLSRVSGACYVVRGEGGLPAQEGTLLQDGDVVDLGNAGENGAVSIQSAGKSDIVLKRGNGRFFKLQIGP